MSADQTSAIDWDTHEPSGAVHRAAIVLSSADSVTATCFGWVPQAHAALAAALDVQEMAKVIDPAAFGPMTHGSNVSRYFRAQQAAGEKAIAIRDAILGGAQ